MLYTMIPLMEEAVKGKYGIPAPNIFGIDMAKAAIEAAEEMNSPLIIDAGMTSFRDLPFFIPMVRELCQKSRVPLAINLDHGKTYEHAVIGVKAGYTSMMADRSKLPFDENVKESAAICKMAHAAGMSFEAELGHVGFADSSFEKEVADAAAAGSSTNSIDNVKATFTKVDEAVKFVELTQVDCLAIAVGTIHGNYPKGLKPELQFDLIEEIRDAVKIPLVLHGCSGTGDENLSHAAKLGVAKFNIGTELLQNGYKYQDEFYARENANRPKGLNGMERYWECQDAFMEGYKERIKHYIEVLGCKDKAW